LFESKQVTNPEKSSVCFMQCAVSFGIDSSYLTLLHFSKCFEQASEFFFTELTFPNY